MNSSAADQASAAAIITTLIKCGDATIAAHSQRFFKSAPGQYGHGDKFIGLRVPTIRSALKQEQQKLTLGVTVALLYSDWHEVRLFAAFAMLHLYQSSEQITSQRAIVKSYLLHRARINNWDIVDGSAPGITGAWYFTRKRSPLDKLVHSKSLWDRRIAMLSTFYYIRQNDFTDTYKYAEQLLLDPEDLMHKACGWMLREAGKRDQHRLLEFLDSHVAAMPRTMLRYSIEKLPETLRQYYLTLPVQSR